MQIFNFLYFSSFSFKESHVFNEEDNPSQVAIVEEELDNIGTDGIGNLRIYLELCSPMRNGGILSGESHIDFRTHCVIMIQRT